MLFRSSKPIPPMSKDQELDYLRKKVKKLQDEADEFQAGERVARPASDETEVPAKKAEEDTKLAEDIPSKVTPPQRDELIPPAHLREKKSLKEVRADLAAELKDAKAPKKKVTDGAQPKDVKDREAIVDNLLKKK